ncbi:MAG: hypothetical protein K0Q59_2329 [Paenibacillus sp.]|nr:hypothetical protein [Paenibacillus sp.]
MPQLILVIGDMLVLFLFVLLGRQDHQMAFSWSEALETAIPFALGWLIALAVFRTYRTRTAATAGKAALFALLTCCVAVPLGLGFRSLWLGRLPNASFAIVAFPLIAAFMTVWRIFASFLLRRF